MTSALVLKKWFTEMKPEALINEIECFRAAVKEHYD
jgi:hypothetical protein